MLPEPAQAREGRARGGSRGRAGRGFAYLVVLGLVAATAGATTWLVPVWQTAAQRERERELLAIGGEFRNAIGSYVAAGIQRSYPRRLEDLLLDPRQPGIRRHLRRIYADPMTGSPRWGLVRAPDGGIAGVYSLSEARPFKQQGFEPADSAFAGARRYADWQFVHRDAAPVPARPVPAPGPR